MKIPRSRKTAKPGAPEFGQWLALVLRHYKWRTEDFQEAVNYFQKAIGTDPHWAPPYAALADTYGWLWIAGALPPQEVLPRFNAAFKTALEIE